MSKDGTVSTGYAFEPRYYTMGDIDPKEIVDNVHIRIFSGSATTLSYVTIAPGALVPEHSHPHEQLGLILEGDAEFWIGEDRRRLQAGDAYRIPPHAPHGARGGENGCVVLDVFSPVREEYEALYS
ncbi:MAG: cupin domain-containing protein [Chloroflexi bacterium]|nr:cupin domain-containing protein [Chloroflexota bacterium]